VVRLVRKNETGLDVIDLRPGCYLPENQYAKVIGVPYGYVKQKVIGSRDMVDLTDFRNAPYVFTELSDTTRFVFCQTNGNHCQQAHSQNGGIDIGMEPADGSHLAQTPRSLKGGRR